MPRTSSSSTRAEIYNTAAKFLEEEMMQCKNCVNVFTDGAASMMAKSKGFVSKVKQTNPDVQITRCFLHREALMAKTLPDELNPLSIMGSI